MTASQLGTAFYVAALAFLLLPVKARLRLARQRPSRYENGVAVPIVRANLIVACFLTLAAATSLWIAIANVNPIVAVVTFVVIGVVMYLLSSRGARNKRTTMIRSLMRNERPAASVQVIRSLWLLTPVAIFGTGRRAFINLVLFALLISGAALSRDGSAAGLTAFYGAQIPPRICGARLCTRVESRRGKALYTNVVGTVSAPSSFAINETAL